jgi:hypothetical protein
MPYAEISLLKKFDQFKLVTMSLKESKDQILAHLREVCELGMETNINIFWDFSNIENENLERDDRDNRIEFLKEDLVYLEFDNFVQPTDDEDDDEEIDYIFETRAFCFTTDEVRMMLEPGFKDALKAHIIDKESHGKIKSVKELMEAHPECFKKEEN